MTGIVWQENVCRVVSCRVVCHLKVLFFNLLAACESARPNISSIMELI